MIDFKTLQIDDYLTVDNVLCKVSGLDNHSQFCVRVYFPPKYEFVSDSICEPILLTKEILLFNGYEKDESFGITDYVSGDGRVILRAGEQFVNSERKWAVHIDNADYDTVMTCEVSYVHEFQNMLRHCGIEDKIKIEGWPY